MRIVIGSAGRRVYLVRWFQEALRKAGIQGQVYVFENDKNAASVAVADGFVRMPRYEDPDYHSELLGAIEELRPHLFFSLNDYELTHLSEGLAADIRQRGVIVPSLTQELHAMVADKLAMYARLRTVGIKTPSTVLLSDSVNAEKLLSETDRVIVKDRFGSGSSGLQRVESKDLLWFIHSNQQKAPGLELGIKNFDALVLQPELAGEEYGLDIVTPLTGGAVQGLLARRKLVMRSGETNVAETVDPCQFGALADRLAETFGSQGLIDVDVVRKSNGENQVIDINPRFGGGYPFNHVAGANVPDYYVASILGDPPGNDWKEYEFAHRAAKYEESVSFLSDGKASNMERRVT